LEGRVAFAAGDFMSPPFAAESFDAVIAIESFDHAPDKRAFVQSMSALLKPGGRLIIVDGFKAPRPFSSAEENRYRKFLAGWAVPHLCTEAELRLWASESGMAEVHGEDITADVMPHAFAIYRFAFLFVPLRLLLLALRLTSREKVGNAAATYHQYRTLRDGLWNYGVFCFRKPL
jgi:ubiquinone/menaquinone biosynthesis C-methylase UbiE